uniref:Seminal fluid protein HACP044 n=1 Tax=Papilio xuthus TaxID=66420 RepID=I4DJU7_PAPXU|nr:unknown secreted protein [Papilio xuthus]
MATLHFIVLFVAAFVAIEAQRPFYAGSRPIGYPEVEGNALGNRFGEDADAPIEARGDGNLINRFNSMPLDNRPFWYINWRAYDNLRRNQQTWPISQNGFIHRI